MASIIISNSHGPDHIDSINRDDGPGHWRERHGHAESEKGSEYSHDYYRHSKNSSHDGLYRHTRLYQTSNKRNHEFKTYLLDDKIQKPWTEDKKYKRPRRGNWVIIGAFFLAIACAGVLNWRIFVGVPKHDYCLILDDSFSSLDESIWSHKVQVDGFGTDSFDWTTTDSRNAFTDSEGLHIVPTLTTATTDISEDQIFDGYTLDLTADGDNTCTADPTGEYYTMECIATSNITSRAIIPPLRSARLTTQGAKFITYGRVEVQAKLPKGDWLWPAIWMMPENSVYGGWPMSGEIDIMESRGNARGYKPGGRAHFASTLHWGPSWLTDAWRRTTHSENIQRTDYSEDFHTFGLEWSKDYIYTYVDNRLQQVLYVSFKKENLWEFGKFEGQLDGLYENGTLLTNPWFGSDNNNAPFDQAFYLILNVAVGGRTGFFPDGIGGKPWVDGRESAASDFYAAKSQWEPTWGSGNSNGMTVKNVKMWQEGKCSS